MPSDHLQEITTLLDQAGAAHGRYEESELNGVYDQEWARWYAAYAVEQGLSALLDHTVTAEQVAAFFSCSFEDYKRDGITENWSAYTARRLQAEL
jgi:hypothetical protein